MMLIQYDLSYTTPCYATFVLIQPKNYARIQIPHIFHTNLFPLCDLLRYATNDLVSVALFAYLTPLCDHQWGFISILVPLNCLFFSNQ